MTTSGTKLLELCEQYHIAGWLSTHEYEYFRQEIQRIRKSPGAGSSHHMEMLARLIQQSISTAQQVKNQESQRPAINDDITQPNNKRMSIKASNTTTSSDNPTNWMIYTPSEFQTHVVAKDKNSTINIKELFVEMCFYARLGYIQPPCCLRCTYSECYNASSPLEERDDDDNDEPPRIPVKKVLNQKKQHHTCQRYVVWRKDTNIVLHPDTIASNILVLPCALVRQLLSTTDVPKVIQDSQATTYQYDPIHKSMTVR